MKNKIPAGLFMIPAILLAVTFAQKLPAGSKEGRIVYNANCRFCHGYFGKGNGVLKGLFKSGIGKLKADEYTVAGLKESLGKTLNTRGKMRHFTSDLPDDIMLRQVLDYISLGKVTGKLLYSGSCAGCHGASADGNGPMTGFKKEPANLKGTEPGLLKKRTKASRSKYIRLHQKIPHIRTVPSDAQLKDLLELINTF